MRILGISGSLRAESLNTQLLHIAAEELPAGVELDRFDALGEIPPYDEDVEGFMPESVGRLRDAIVAADAVLFASPEYNGSIPGQLKNALDWASRQAVGSPLRGKPVAVMGASPGQFGGTWAQGELRKVLGIMGARVVPTELAVGKAHERIGGDADLHDAVAALVGELVGESTTLEVAA
jgi:chromate reductase